MTGHSELRDAVRDLRRRWKPTKVRLQRVSSEHPLVVRMHRSFSWINAASAQAEDAADEQLVFLWIGLNALYGRWDGIRKEPESDAKTLKQLLKRLNELDRDHLVIKCLEQNREKIVAVCSDPFLNTVFWRLLDTEKRFHSQRDHYSIQRLYREENWPLVLDELIQRIYLIRCQLVHGAATYGGSLNRKTVALCADIMQGLMEAFVTVIIDYGLHENWDDLCYPPVRESE